MLKSIKNHSMDMSKHYSVTASNLKEFTIKPLTDLKSEIENISYKSIEDYKNRYLLF